MWVKTVQIDGLATLLSSVGNTEPWPVPIGTAIDVNSVYSFLLKKHQHTLAEGIVPEFP